MRRTVAEALKSSTAHGISHAVAARSLPLKIMYTVAFLLFCGLLTKNVVTLLLKLSDTRKMARDYEYNAAAFEFPDLYFCPTNPYSGSYPYLLTGAQADEVNAEVDRVGAIFDDYFAEGAHISNTQAKHDVVQRGMSARLIADSLMQRPNQSVVSSYVVYVQAVDRVDWETFYHPYSLVCFKPKLSEESKRMLQHPGNALKLWLFTDPYFPDHGFPGHPVRPIRAGGSNHSMDIEDWNIVDLSVAKVTGFNLVIAQRSTYPSSTHETSVLLAPGNSYDMRLEMEEFKFGDELHGRSCVQQTEAAAFADPVTAARQNFEYSFASCYYEAKNELANRTFGCLQNQQPKLWKYRTVPYCLNVSAVPRDTLFGFLNRAKQLTSIETEARRFCRHKYPKTYRQYTPTFSFAKWPSLGGAVINFFADANVQADNPHWSEDSTPALMRLISLAAEMKRGNSSPHIEARFRSYIAESLLQISISSKRSTSTRIFLRSSYTVTQFLADSGGLLGLYIGSSLLTLLEAVELLHCLLAARFAGAKTRADAAEPLHSVQTGRC